MNFIYLCQYNLYYIDNNSIKKFLNKKAGTKTEATSYQPITLT